MEGSCLRWPETPWPVTAMSEGASSAIGAHKRSTWFMRRGPAATVCVARISRREGAAPIRALGSRAAPVNGLRVTLDPPGVLQEQGVEHRTEAANQEVRRG
jgi:hypothetical protein